MPRTFKLTLSTISLAAIASVATAGPATPAHQAAAAPVVAAAAGPSLDTAARIAEAERTFRTRLEQVERLRIDAAVEGRLEALREIDRLFDDLVLRHQQTVQSIRRLAAAPAPATVRTPPSRPRRSFQPTPAAAPQTAAPEEGRRIRLARDVTRREAASHTIASETPLTVNDPEAPFVRREATSVDQSKLSTEGPLSALPPVNERGEVLGGRRRAVTKKIVPPGMGLVSGSETATAASPKAGPVTRRRPTPKAQPAPGLDLDARIARLRRDIKGS